MSGNKADGSSKGAFVAFAVTLCVVIPYQPFHSFLRIKQCVLGSIVIAGANLKRSTMLVQFCLVMVLMPATLTAAAASINNSSGNLDPCLLTSQGFHDDDSGLTFYWSLCKNASSVSDLSSLCNDTKASVCAVKDSQVLVWNAGQIMDESNTVRESTDHFSLTLEHGQECHGGLVKSNYKTRFDFFCNDGEPTSDKDIMLTRFADTCTYNFFWHTPLACVEKRPGDNVENGCILHVPQFDQKLDFATLKHPNYYKVERDGQKFLVNLCGGVIGSNLPDCPDESALCQLDAENKTLSVVTNWSSNTYYNQNNAIVSSVGAEDKVFFHLECDEAAVDPVLTYLKHENGFNFKVRTRTVCMDKPASCKVEDPDSGEIFDLSSLVTSTEDWIAYDTRHGFTDRRYHLSVCKPLSPSSMLYQCPDLHTGVCQSSIISKESSSLGKVPPTKPLLQWHKSDQYLLLRYQNGSPCNGKYNYSSQIQFRCDSKEQGPRFLYSDNDCTFVFEWFTPAACPQVQVSSTSCIVRDKYYGNTYDMRPLHLATEDRSVSSASFSYNINICGQGMNLACGSAKNASVCRTKGSSSSVAAGYTSTEKLTLVDSQLTLDYTGAPCGEDPTKNLSAKVLFKCDHSRNLGHPEFASSDPCSVYFVWTTTLACPPFREIECRVADPDDDTKVYDLWPLSLPGSNYEVWANKKSRYLINVCRSLVHTPPYKCPYNTAICKGTQNEVGSGWTFTNLGEPTDGPKFDSQKRLVLEYPMGGMCTDASTTESHMTTRIIFKCQKGLLESSPEFIEKVGCTHIFMWEHDAGCPLTPNGSEDNDSGNCTVKDHITGHVFDMTPAINTSSNLQANDSQDNVYYVNICGPLMKKPADVSKCGERSGACVKASDGSGFVGLGTANQNLYLLDGGPVLKYERTNNASTTIRFRCAPLPSTSDSQLVFVEKNGQDFYLDYFTSLACPHTVSCRAIDQATGASYDLAPLMNYQKDFYANVEGSVDMFWSVCKPLVGRSGLHCPPGSAVCSAVPVSSSKWKKEASYGLATETPKVKSRGVVTLDYKQGTMCDKKRGVFYTSSIEFRCNPAAFPGQPRDGNPDSEDNGCHKKYVWETLVACANATLPTEFTSPVECRIYHPLLRDFVDLGDLKIASREHKVEDESKGATYYVQSCGRSRHCNGSLCIQSFGAKSYVSMGTIKSAVYDFDQDELIVRYASDSKCENSITNYSAEVRFQCDQNVADANSVPRLVANFPCHPIFRWRTRAVCTGTSAKLTMGQAQNKTDTPLWGVAVVLLIAGTVVMVLVKKPQYRVKCRLAADWARQKLTRGRDDDRSMLVQSNVNIPAFGSIEDDDELILA